MKEGCEPTYGHVFTTLKMWFLSFFYIYLTNPSHMWDSGRFNGRRT